MEIICDEYYLYINMYILNIFERKFVKICLVDILVFFLYNFLFYEFLVEKGIIL